MRMRDQSGVPRALDNFLSFHEESVECHRVNPHGTTVAQRALVIKLLPGGPSRIEVGRARAGLVKQSPELVEDIYNAPAVTAPGFLKIFLREPVTATFSVRDFRRDICRSAVAYASARALESKPLLPSLFWCLLAKTMANCLAMAVSSVYS